MKKRRKKSSANSRKHRKKTNFTEMQNAQKNTSQKQGGKKPKRENYLKINLPFEEAMKIATSLKKKTQP